MKSLEFVLITDRKACEENLCDIVVSTLEGGVSTVQLREKELSTKDLYTLAKKLRTITEEHGANLVINDRVDIALAVNADGVHLGWQSLSIDVVRKLVGPEMMIGFSAHSFDEVKKASFQGVDYVSISPVYRTLSKDPSTKPLGVVELKKIKRYLSVPLIGLGGINEFNVKEVLENGADGVAVISALLRSKRPEQTAKTMHDIIKKYQRLKDDQILGGNKKWSCKNS
ncbi:MAG: thiamine phosphate synthase [Candidatus Scalindua sp. AMX11]|nr:MAG: thiamine phosphate synthase [Candidatus Scalindua sp.]NOG83211.1 thiamine phosphate synthase [Planctomycetota bacterium]RZV77576.1 MAG: thiamine phosphate synthase [Candidatus Scalindua sp. SCAELEC01]TDE64545.1 MAG: thiamine phosphate synthase [Candidatus Scalindua sp. AMX11]GJQ58643.1 MAG: thiamine-phosphate synthase [Candidatus Scalindua sp.]